eukprot:6079663-Amphidinium_carterae.1
MPVDSPHSGSCPRRWDQAEQTPVTASSRCRPWTSALSLDSNTKTWTSVSPQKARQRAIAVLESSPICSSNGARWLQPILVSATPAACAPWDSP